MVLAGGVVANHSRVTANASWAQSRQRTFLLFLAPALVVLFVVTALPTAFLLASSLTPYDLTKPDSLRFTGLDNFARLFADDRFWNSVWVQARFSFWTVLLQLLIGLGLALLLSGRHRFLEFIRTAFVLPMVLPPVVVALIWKVLFTPDISVLNWSLGLLGLPEPAWLADPSLALGAIIVANTWEWFPFVLLLLIAALQMLPTEPMEAARIDGASAWQVFRDVILPLIKPALLVAGLFRLIDSFKAFPEVYIMTGGGPGVVTEVTNYYAYLQGFSYTRIGYSSAIIVVMLITTFGLSLAIIKAVGTGSDVE